MQSCLRHELAGLQHLSVADLRGRYAQLFGEATRAGNKAWLRKRIAWRLQALAEGDLSDRARQRAAALANDADLRLSPPPAPTPAVNAAPADAPDAPVPGPVPWDHRLPLPGGVLTRRYKGQPLQVTVLPVGFAYSGRVFPSLSAVAKAITGSHCNGYLFFRLTKTREAS